MAMANSSQFGADVSSSTTSAFLEKPAPTITEAAPCKAGSWILFAISSMYE